MVSACWITKAVDPYSEYVIFIAFARQRRLRERASVLRLYTDCLSVICIFKISDDNQADPARILTYLFTYYSMERIPS